MILTLLGGAARAEGSPAGASMAALARAVAERVPPAARVDAVPVEDYVRLHVIADGDDDAAQALKLEVRDACLMCARTLLAGCADADAAWETVNDNLNLIELAALVRARVCGWTGRVSAEAGVFAFPERVYGDRVVPAGEYRAVRVVIGEGEGRNWWCVLYPTLCLPEDVEPGEPVRFHSTVLTWLLDWLGGAA